MVPELDDARGPGQRLMVINAACINQKSGPCYSLECKGSLDSLLASPRRIRSSACHPTTIHALGRIRYKRQDKDFSFSYLLRRRRRRLLPSHYAETLHGLPRRLIFVQSGNCRYFKHYRYTLMNNRAKPRQIGHATYTSLLNPDFLLSSAY
jgi:hypothetical protein